MRTANFNFIYVFRRKDGAAINAADKKTAVELIPPEMNRRKLADDGKAIIVGSNYRMASENLKLLEENFALQDFSKPESEIIANATVNTQ